MELEMSDEFLDMLYKSVPRKYKKILTLDEIKRAWFDSTIITGRPFIMSLKAFAENKKFNDGKYVNLITARM